MHVRHALFASLVPLALACSSDPGAGEPAPSGGIAGPTGGEAPEVPSAPRLPDGLGGGATPGGGAQIPSASTGPASNRCTPAAPKGAVLWVATNGSDAGDGSPARPFASITAAVRAAKDESTILVKPGTYTGRQRLDAAFPKGIVVRSEVPWMAKLRNNDLVVSVYTGQGITLEGFDIAHAGSGASPVVIHIQDLRGEPGGTDTVSRITLRNNVIHDSYNNDLVKLNNGASKVTFEGNIFYNQSGSDEHIDVNSVTDVVIQDNLFFNDFAGSGRTNRNDTSSYVVIKDSNDDDDTNLGSLRITVRRNVFANWEGNAGQGFLLVGEDGKSYYEARDVLVENNLMLANAANRMQSTFMVKGARDITFRHNTVVGDGPARASVLRATREGDNPVVENVRFFNNVWSSPGGTMERFSDTDPSEARLFALSTNDYWNAGKSIPSSADDALRIDLDAKRVVADPRLPALTKVALPRLRADGKLADGSATQCEAFERIVKAHGMPADGSAVLDRADRAESPDHDILGNARKPGVPSDLGAYER